MVDRKKIIIWVVSVVAIVLVIVFIVLAIAIPEKGTDQNKNNTTTEEEATSGRVIIKYIDQEGNKIEVEDREANLVFGQTYSYSAKNIEGYILTSDQHQEASTTKENPEAIIKFTYKKQETQNSKTGAITIQYKDSSGNEIKPQTEYKDLEIFKIYSYTPESIDGYTIIDNNKKDVFLTQDTSSITVVFTYKKNEVEQPPNNPLTDPTNTNTTPPPTTNITPPPPTNPPAGNNGGGGTTVPKDEEYDGPPRANVIFGY